jgi:hypothetical protein
MTLRLAPGAYRTFRGDHRLLRGDTRSARSVFSATAREVSARLFADQHVRRHDLVRPGPFARLGEVSPRGFPRRPTGYACRTCVFASALSIVARSSDANLAD